MKQNGVVCLPGPAFLFFIFRFEYLISGLKSYGDFRETGPWCFTQLHRPSMGESADQESRISLLIFHRASASSLIPTSGFLFNIYTYNSLEQ